MLVIIFCLLFSFFDIKNRRISVPLWGVSYALSLIFLFFAAGKEVLLTSLINSVLCFCAYLLLLLLSRKKFGFGDVLFSALCTLFLPSPVYIWIFMLGSVVLAVLFLLILWVKAFIQKEKEPDFSSFRLPYIPFMSLSVIILLCLIRFSLI
jgi:Flp pilus assembly protein protease CpaA